MQDVAQRLGVSKMTVSRALRARAPLLRAPAETMRQRVLSACLEMGYVLDKTASTFASKRSGFVVTLIPALNNSNFSDTAHGLTEALDAHGLQLLLGYTDYSLVTEERLLRTMLTRKPEGVVLTGGNHTPESVRMVKAAGVPVVEMWDLIAAPMAHNIGFSNADATAKLVRALYNKGYRRIAYMSGAMDSDARGADRRRGYERAIRALRLPAGRAVEVGRAPVSMEQGARAVVEVMQRWPDTDALVCVSDHAAFGALMECKRRRWAVPARIAIAGFGGFEVGEAAFPRISTVKLDCPALGRAAGELLGRAILAAREGRVLASETVRVPYEIALREST
jgi:LacI family gluconate utilization system Gnt-I transcriptional repressor